MAGRHFGERSSEMHGVRRRRRREVRTKSEIRLPYTLSRFARQQRERASIFWFDFLVLSHSLPLFISCQGTARRNRCEMRATQSTSQIWTTAIPRFIGCTRCCSFADASFRHCHFLITATITQFVNSILQWKFLFLYQIALLVRENT